LGTQDKQSQSYLADELIGIVEGWEKTGWPGLTDTTYPLFKYWFKRDERSLQKILSLLMLYLKNFETNTIRYSLLEQRWKNFGLV